MLTCGFSLQAKALAERESAARKLSEEREREERRLEDMRKKADDEARYGGVLC